MICWSRRPENSPPCSSWGDHTECVAQHWLARGRWLTAGEGKVPWTTDNQGMSCNVLGCLARKEDEESQRHSSPWCFGVRVFRISKDATLWSVASSWTDACLWWCSAAQRRSE